MRYVVILHLSRLSSMFLWETRKFLNYQYIFAFLENGTGLKDKVRILEQENQKLQKAYDDIKEVLQNEIARQATQVKTNMRNVDELQKKFLGIDLNL